MARKASSKLDALSTRLGFEADFCPFGLSHSDFVIPAWVQHFIHHLAPHNALRDTASAQREEKRQVVIKVTDNMADFVVANRSMNLLTKSV